MPTLLCHSLRHNDLRDSTKQQLEAAAGGRMLNDILYRELRTFSGPDQRKADG